MTPLEILGFSGDLQLVTVEEMERRWKELRSQHHPDKGGSTEMFIYFRNAYEKCYGQIHELQVCSDCAGAGRVKVTQGFYTTTMLCATCQGSGSRS